MQIGYVGLGKMGHNMALRLLEKGHEVVAYNKSPEPVENFIREGGQGAFSLREMVSKLSASPKVVWIMVPHAVVDGLITEIAELLSEGDIIIDGGNSFYKNTVKNAKALEQRGIELIDAGVSGGPSGARHGASIMIGGKEEVFKSIEGLFEDLATEEGYNYLGKSGSGHFVKMVHNGIEYGMMQAIAEGFDILKNSPEFELDLDKIIGPYGNGSVIESALISWLGDAFEKYGPELEEISGTVAHSGEGEWTIKTAKAYKIKTPVISKAFEARIKSQRKPTYQGKVVSAMRGEFGGHEVKKKK